MFLPVFAALCFLQSVFSADIRSQRVIGVKDSEGLLVWSSEGGIAAKDFQVYKPKLLGPEWREVGHRAQLDFESLKQPIFRFRESRDDAGSLAKPEGFSWVWDDSGSTCFSDASAWRANCPPGFVAVSDFFYDANRVTSPGKLMETAGCVKLEYTAPCEGYDTEVWTDKGTWALNDLAVWSVKAKDDQIGGFLYVNNQYGAKPPVTPRCILKSAVEDLF